MRRRKREYKVEAKDQDNAIAYSNTTSVTLHGNWKRYEIDLAGADLQGITHLFGFEVNTGQAFYIKGPAYC